MGWLRLVGSLKVQVSFAYSVYIQEKLHVSFEFSVCIQDISLECACIDTATSVESVAHRHSRRH